MKIIIPNLPIPVLRYLAHCLHSIPDEQAQCYPWDINHTSIIDMFDEIKPDLVCLHTSQLNSSFNTICQEFDFKYILIVENTVPKNLPQTPDAIIDISNSHNLDTQHQNVIRFQPMCHILNLQDAKYIEKFQSTIVVDTTFTTLNNDIMGLLAFLTSEYPTKIIGSQPIKLHHYLGATSVTERANFFKSANIVIDIGNVGDCWDAAYLKVPSISISHTNSIILTCKNLNMLKHQVDTLLTNDLVTPKYITESYAEACKNTSFHFSSTLFNMIDEPKLASILFTVLESYI